MRISDWSSDVCSSDLLWDWLPPATVANLVTKKIVMPPAQTGCQIPAEVRQASGEMMIGNLNAFGPEASFSYPPKPAGHEARSEENTSELQSIMRISYAVFCLKKNNTDNQSNNIHTNKI